MAKESQPTNAAGDGAGAGAAAFAWSFDGTDDQMWLPFFSPPLLLLYCMFSYGICNP